MLIHAWLIGLCAPAVVKRLPALMCVALAVGAEANAWQDHAQIRRTAEAAVQAQRTTPDERISVSAEELDSRLRLPACEARLEAAVPDTARNARRVSVEVRCGSAPWKLYVPVQVTTRRAVVVAARALPRGKVLAPGDVILAERDSGALGYGYLLQPSAAVGQTLRRPVNEGAALTAGVLEAPLLIRRGQQVTLEARSGTLAVRSAAVAEADGALGQIIPVSNAGSGKTVQAIVRSEKSVEVLLR